METVLADLIRDNCKSPQYMDVILMVGKRLMNTCKTGREWNRMTTFLMSYSHIRLSHQQYISTSMAEFLFFLLCIRNVRFPSELYI